MIKKNMLNRKHSGLSKQSGCSINTKMEEGTRYDIIRKIK